MSREVDERQEIPLGQLQVDPDPRYWPSAALVDAIAVGTTLDRPLVPLLNEIQACGITTFGSCAGHILSEGPSPRLAYVQLLSADTRSLAIARGIQRLVTAPTEELWVMRFATAERKPMRFNPIGLYVAWGRRLENAEDLRAIDTDTDAAARWVAKARAALPPAGIPSPELTLAEAALRWAQELPAAAIAPEMLEDEATLDQVPVAHDIMVSIRHPAEQAAWALDVHASRYDGDDDEGHPLFEPVWRHGVCAGSWGELERAAVAMLS